MTSSAPGVMENAHATATTRGWWHTKAREMRAAGIGRRAIAKHFGLSLNSVTYLFSEKTRESQRLRQASRKQKTLQENVEWVSEARAQRTAGKRLSDIARSVDRDPSIVWRQISDIPFKATCRFSATQHVEVPKWVRRAGLVEDFRERVRLYDEVAAASHCRALIHEMKASK